MDINNTTMATINATGDSRRLPSIRVDDAADASEPAVDPEDWDPGEPLVEVAVLDEPVLVLVGRAVPVVGDVPTLDLP